MPDGESSPPREQFGPFQFALLILSLILLAAIAADWVLALPREISRLLFYIDTAVCLVFFLDFLVRFRAAPSKLGFLKWGWLDLLAAIPALEVFRWARLFRIVRIVRLIRAIGTFRRLVRLLADSKAHAGVASVVTITFLVISFGSAGVLVFEEGHPEANIHTAEEALWWAMTTVTTVGYGDRFPVTDAGRLIAVCLMVSGIGLFGTLSGVAASFFLGGEKDEPASRRAQAEMLARLDALQQELASLRAERSRPPAPPAPQSLGGDGKEPPG
jgi:voltage-gated potassium channel